MAADPVAVMHIIWSYLHVCTCYMSCHYCGVIPASWFVGSKHCWIEITWNPVMLEEWEAAAEAHLKESQDLPLGRSRAVLLFFPDFARFIYVCIPASSTGVFFLPLLLEAEILASNPKKRVWFQNLPLQPKVYQDCVAFKGIDRHDVAWYITSTLISFVDQWYSIYASFHCCFQYPPDYFLSGLK